MNGNEKITSRRLRRALGQTANIAGKIDFPHADISFTQDVSQHTGKLPVKSKLALPTSADRATILETMPDIDSHQRRRGKCCGRQGKKGKKQKESVRHRAIIRPIEDGRRLFNQRRRRHSFRFDIETAELLSAHSAGKSKIAGSFPNDISLRAAFTRPIEHVDKRPGALAHDHHGGFFRPTNIIR